MTAGPATPGADEDEPAHPGDPPPPPEKPLRKRAWYQREIEKVVPEDIVSDVTDKHIERAEVAPWDIGDVHLYRQVGVPTLTVFQDEPGAAGSVDPALVDEEVEWLLAAEEQRPETRSLHADAPESVRPGQRFAIAVELLCAAPTSEGAQAELRPFLVPPSGRTVRIDLHASGGLRVLTDPTCSLTVYPGKDSDPARFELEAVSPGPAAVTLRAFADPAEYLGQLRLDLPVSDAATGIHRAVESGPIAWGDAPQRSATLEVDFDATKPALSFRLRGPGEIGVQRPVVVPLTEALEDIASGLQRKLDQIAKGTGWSPKAVEALLKGTGSDLWQRLLPDAVKGLLLRNLSSLDSLVIIGADDPIPWELLFPVTPGQPQTFLSDQLLVSRWAFGASAPRLALGAGAARYVLPDSAPPAALAEIVQIEALLGAGKRIGTLDALLDELDAATFGLLHFAAHNIVASDLPASAWVKLDQPFQQGMLGADRTNAFARSAPLVFMNACNSGAASPLWVGSTGWAGRFLAAGAGAFVGSLWQVRDGPARDFAASFYADVKAGKTIGAAFQAARSHVGKNGDPTRLGYTLFGNTAATLVAHGGDSP